MDNQPTPVPFESLLARREWVRRLARALVRDESLADDLEQEVWLDALRRPPRTLGSLGSWFASAMRNNLVDFRRSESRRRTREAVVARPEAGKSAADVVAEAELVRKVVAAVLELDEPGRGTLLLRYFEDLPLRAVAERQGIPLETVRTRIRTALLALRARFDADRGGERAAWSVALLPLAAEPAAPGAAVSGMGTATNLGGIIMAKKAVATGAVALLLVGAVVAWEWNRTESKGPVRVAELASFTAGPSVKSGPGAVPRAPSTTSKPATAAPAPIPSPPPVGPPGTRTIAWSVEPGESAVPPDGTAIPLRPIPGAGPGELSLPVGRMVGKDLVVEGLPEKFWNAVAVAPDGSLARLFVPDGAARGDPTSFRKSRRIDLILREEDGAAAAGERVVARESGNNPLAPPETSDAEGRIAFVGLQGGRAHLSLLPGIGEAGAQGTPVGTVDLETGDARLEVVLRPRFALLARISEEGKPALPGGLVIGVAGATIVQRSSDPATGTVRLMLRAGSQEPRLRVTATVPGKSSATAEAAWSEKEGAFVAALSLERKPAGTLSVRVLPPADERYSWELRRLDGPKGVEVVQGSIFMSARYDPVSGSRDHPVFTGLASGRYQYVTDCGLATEVVEFGEGPGTREVTLDLSKVQVVTGRFEAPPSVDLAGVRVLVEGEGLAGPTMPPIGGHGAGVYRDTFRVRVPGDRPVRLRAEHPSLVAPSSGGTVELTGPAEGVVLRLVEGTHAVFRMEPGAPADADPFHGPTTILLYRGSPDGPPASTHIAAGGDPFRIGGFLPGSWSLYVDAPGRAPGVLRDVVLGDGRTDLGTIRLEEGASVRLVLKVAAGAVPPDLFVLARPLGGPPHFRGLNSFGKGEPVLRGLGKGPYQVTVQTSGYPGSVLFEKRVESEGAGEMVLEVDLR